MTPRGHSLGLAAASISAATVTSVADNIYVVIYMTTNKKARDEHVAGTRQPQTTTNVAQLLLASHYAADA